MNRGAVCQIQFTVPYHYVKFDIINKSKSGFIGLGQAMPFGLVKTGYGEQWRKQLSLIYRPQSSFAGRDAFAVELGALGAPQTDHKNEDRFGAVGSVTTALYFEVAVQ